MITNSNKVPGGFTVLMAVYHKDDPSQFDRALSSIFENSLPPDAVLVVADGALTLELDTILARHLESNHTLRVCRLRENKGLAAALNEGLAHVESEWVARADADDINHRDRFERQAAALREREFKVDIVGSAITEVDFDGTHLATRRPPLEHDEICKFAARRNPFNHMTVWFRTALARQLGGYPEIHLKEDYALWAMMISSGAQCLNLRETLVDALTGPELYKRRGGVTYALEELKLQKHLYKHGLKPLSLSGCDFILRSSVFLMPKVIRSYIYNKFLRN